MNRKAEGEMIWYIIPLIIVVFLIIILTVPTLRVFIGQHIPFAKNIPGFTQSNESVESVEIIRYNIETGDVQYYTGTTWIDFPEGEEVYIGSKVLSGDKLNLDFQKYYQQARERKEAILSESACYALFDLYQQTGSEKCLGDYSVYLRVFFTSLQFSDEGRFPPENLPIMKGFVDTYKRPQDHELYNRWPIFVYSSGEIFFIRDGKTDTVLLHEKDLGNDYNTIVNTAYEFRDGVYENPIELTGYGSFRVEKKSPYVIVNLAENEP